MTNDSRPVVDPRDTEARRAAVDPTENVVLEASAGTGKTRVLVDRYVNLLRAGVDPRNILAMTFTRKAAAEMRERIVRALGEAAAHSPEDEARWRQLRDRLNDIAISTIDAFCLSLLREFPLEADLDPGFDVADETEVPRLVEESLDDALRICRARARGDEGIALLFAHLGEKRLRAGLAALLERRAVAERVLGRVTSLGPRDLTAAQACRQGAERLAAELRAIPGGLPAFLESGPVHHPRYARLAADIGRLACAAPGESGALDPAAFRGVLERLRAHFFTKAGTPRKRAPGEYPADAHAGPAARRTHWALVAGAAPGLADAMKAFRRDVNAILSRAVWQVFRIAADRYRRTLEARGVLDFGELLIRARQLVGNMDEFARSRYLLEARYHHVLVDEFQDTSRAQWELVSLLVRAWGEGLGLASDAPLPPSIFVVGDRKQSIYGFRDADAGVLDDAAAEIGALRPGGSPLRAISHSFRSVPGLLGFANDLFRAIASESPDRRDAFGYGDRDAFPVEEGGGIAADDVPLGVIAAADVRRCAEAVAAEIARLASDAQVRDRQSGVRRPIRPADVAILFRSRASHREFQEALDARRIPSYVYNGLGFFEADEVRDIVALLRFLAEPTSDLRAVAVLRSRVVRLSDAGLQRLAPGIAAALTDRAAPRTAARLDAEDAAVLARARSSIADWLALADRVPPAELLDRALADSAYEHEIRGRRAAAARENVKKMRSLVRRLQNSGYLTLARLADHLDRLSAGDESNAVVDAVDAVNLMTVHAAKGLEFPVVFVVNLSRGSGGPHAPIRVAEDAAPEDAVAVGDFESAFDADAAAREREETKRLMYVAVTRARDRLYLASATSDGAFKPRKGSLGDVLPASMRGLFDGAAAATTDGAPIAWAGGSGAVHAFRICLPVPAPEPGGPAPFAAAQGGQENEPAPPADDFGAIADSASLERRPITGSGDARPRQSSAAPASENDAGVVLGRVVHRMFQARISGDLPPDQLAAKARTLVTADEFLTVADLGGLAASAARVFSDMRSQPALRALLDEARCHYEVPISVLPATGEPGGRVPILRGVIDCLACRPDGGVVVVDFKTGGRRPGDRQQLGAYVNAVRSLFPGAPVEGLLVYAGAAS